MLAVNPKVLHYPACSLIAVTDLFHFTFYILALVPGLFLELFMALSLQLFLALLLPPFMDKVRGMFLNLRIKRFIRLVKDRLANRFTQRVIRIHVDVFHLALLHVGTFPLVLFVIDVFLRIVKHIAVFICLTILLRIPLFPNCIVLVNLSLEFFMRGASFPGVIIHIDHLADLIIIFFFIFIFISIFILIISIIVVICIILLLIRRSLKARSFTVSHKDRKHMRTKIDFSILARIRRRVTMGNPRHPRCTAFVAKMGATATSIAIYLCQLTESQIGRT